MKRVIGAALTACLWMGIAGGLPNSQANARLDASTSVESKQANQQEMRERTCRYQWLDPKVWTDREERRTAECVVARFGVVGGFETLWRVGDCESSWFRFASNGGNFLGIFQHMASAWPSRVRSMMPEAWKVGPWWRWTNSRSQVVTTVRMVNGSGGWSAWACA